MRKKILLHVIATNKYDRYVKGLVESARKYFFPDEEVKIVIYTDSQEILSSEDLDILPVKIEHSPWPNPTLKRFHHFWNSREIIQNSDFSFYVDADSLFIKQINWDSLGTLSSSEGMIGAIHPGYKGSRGTPEYRSFSSAYIPNDVNITYFCGGFFGGSSGCFLKAISKMKENIDLDLYKGVTAIWHDESHLNKYFLDNPPICALNPEFTCSESSCPPEGERNIPQSLNINGVTYLVRPYIVFLEKEYELQRDKNKI